MIPFTTEEIKTFDSPDRLYKVYLYDPTVDTMRDIVLGTATSALDVSDKVVTGTISTQLSESVFSSVSLTIKDGLQEFHPDFGINRRYILDRAFVRVTVTDTRWTREVPLFTGFITGSPGYNEARANKQVQIMALDRSSRHGKRRLTSRAYSKGTDYAQVARDIAKDLMGLTDAEILLPANSIKPGGVTAAPALVAHDPLQFVDITAWEMLIEVLWSLKQVPRFNGEGKLTFAYWDVAHTTDVVYTDNLLQRAVVHPQSRVPTPSMIRILGLDANVSQAVSPKQRLVELDVTIGWWDEEFLREVYYSEDRTQRAQNTTLEVVQSVTAGIVPIPGGESWTPIDEFHGELLVDTPYNQEILVLLTAAYVWSVSQPDIAPPFGGPTIPIGKIAAGAAQLAVQYILMQVQRARYEIHGEPFEFIYKEISDAACLNIPTEEFIEWTRTSHLVTDHAWIKELLRALVAKFLAETRPRNLQSISDWRVEIGDRIELLDGRKLFVKGQQIPFRREGGSEMGTINLQCIRL